MTNAPRSLNEALLAYQALALAHDEVRASIQAMEREIEAKDLQIQELEKYRRREEIRESLIRARCEYAQVICHKENIRDGARKTCQNLTELLSMDGLPEDLRADLERKKSEAEAKLHEVHAEIFEEGCKYVELVKPLKDELDTLK